MVAAHLKDEEFDGGKFWQDIQDRHVEFAEEKI